MVGLKVAPVPKLEPPVVAANQFIVGLKQTEEVTASATLPVPHLEPGVAVNG